ncbi:MAG: alpha/beta fold hydrolase [Gemmatimonas sp.]
MSTRGDTLGVETITRRGSRIDGLLAMKGQPQLEWSQAFSNGTPGALTVANVATGAANHDRSQSHTYEVRGDSAYVDDGTPRGRVIASKSGAYTIAIASALQTALLVSHARAHQLTTLSAFLIMGSKTLDATITQTPDVAALAMGNFVMRVQWSPDGTPSAIALPSLNARVVRASALTPASFGPKAATGSRYDPSPTAPYSAQHIRIPTGRGYDLAATLTRPRGVSAPAVVVTISGSAPQDRNGQGAHVNNYAIFREIADTLARRGIATLRWDDRGVGESGGVEGVATGTSADVAEDVRSILEWLRAQSDVDATRIALAGHSEGGLVAPMVAATDARLKGIAILAGPAYTGRRVLLWQQQRAIEPLHLSRSEQDARIASASSQLDATSKTQPWLRYFLSYDPIPTARLIRMPVLVLQGLTDQQVSPEDADALVKAIKSNGNANVTLHKFPSTNHVFVYDPVGAVSGYNSLADPKVRRDVLGALADWAVRVLR